MALLTPMAPDGETGEPVCLYKKALSRVSKSSYYVCGS